MPTRSGPLSAPTTTLASGARRRSFFSHPLLFADSSFAAACRIAAAVVVVASLCTLAIASAPATAGGPAAAGDFGVASRATLPNVPASARGEAVLENDEPQLRATLLVSLHPTPRMGVLFELEEGWHLYWRNPGETGVAPELAFSADGYASGSLAWPAPEIFREADDSFTTYGYSGSVLLSTRLTPVRETNGDERAAAADVGAKSSAGAESMAHVDATVLVCRTQCVPASFLLSTPLASGRGDSGVAGGDAANAAVIAALFDDAEVRVPRAAAEHGWHAVASWAGGAPAVDEPGRIAIELDVCARPGADCDALGSDSAVSFLSFENETFEFEAGEPHVRDPATGRLSLVLPTTRLEAGEDRLRGLIALRASSGETVHAEIDLPIAGGDSQAATPVAAPSAIDWIQVLLLGLLGGIILNGMPCVLPVLAIKVVSVADLAMRSPREVRLHGLAYTAGVLGSMLALASLVLALRLAGHAVGWGFQFQEPLFVAGIAALLVAFALNLFGVFEIELGQGRLADIGQDSTGLTRSAFEGLLAVVLATPCTAPFLGTAVGFAFASSGYAIVAIFVAIGFGLASPFLLVSFFPALARFVPRSGPWMLKLRAGLGFCLLGTVVWLLWIVDQSAGPNAVAALMAALLFMAFLLWTFGQLQPMRSVWLGRASAFGIALLAFGSFNLIDFDVARASTAGGAGGAGGGAHAAGDAGSAEDGEFRPYSEAAVRASLATGRPAFVIFTADWCITCKVNESTVLDRPEVREALSEGGYVLFLADWTRRDETIRTKLAEFGRAGVPLYLVYDPASPDSPRVLSELLTRDAVLAALDLPVDVARP